ncbi:MAG: hypothetical protein R6U21_00635 [Thermoplasmatota archaeon]
MDVTETIDSSLTEQKNVYEVNEEKEIYILKTIDIPKKEPFSYAFLGGMWYSKNIFGFNTDEISLPYPFTTYYTLKILDKTIENTQCRSSIYVKMPVFAIQFPKQCHIVTFDPSLVLHNQDVFPFIQLRETEKSYRIRFYLCSSYIIKQKNHAWLGRGKKKTIRHSIKPGDRFRFRTKTATYNNWENAIKNILKTNLETKKKDSIHHSPEHVFSAAKKALWRSYDHKRGTFIQLPWRDTLGFTFESSSYSLVSYEAVRLDYFSKWYQQTKDEDFKLWMKQLHHLFLQPSLHTIPKKKGRGIIWYNMTTLTKKGLAGYFYMDTGYAGYPGGQATTDYHLLEYLKRNPDQELETVVRQSLDYIQSTQNKDGSWPMAIKQQGRLKFRPERLEEYKTHGGTAEAVRALLNGAAYFDDQRMRTAAKKGLDFLTDKNPICYNGLRDIGIMEPEAFSAVSVINAFLDAYEQEKDEEYLNQAETYAVYIMPWIYQWQTKDLAFQFNFHPISYSITPRLSPYETAWVISTFHRLSTYTKKSWYTALNKALFNQVTSWISHTGGLSEGVFPTGFTAFQRLPMEQTFATVELMNSATRFMELSEPSKKKQNENNHSLHPNYHLSKNKNQLILTKGKQKIFVFDALSASITKLQNVNLNDIGITFSFSGVQKKSIRRNIKQRLRGNRGKYVIGAKDARYAITGVKGFLPDNTIHLDLIKNAITSSDIAIASNTEAEIRCHTKFHLIKINFHFTTLDETLHIQMKITITVKKHDLSTDQQILFPVIGAQSVETSDKSIRFKGFHITGDCSPLVQKESYTAINQTLKANWTHAGLCKKTYMISIPLKKKP